MTAREMIGHSLGLCAIALFFVSYQLKSKKALLVVQTVATGLSCLQYLLIGASSGFALNIVCITRNLFFYHRDKKFFSSLFFPIFFAAVTVGVSLLSWDGWFSLFIVAGLAINTVCLGVCDQQDLRKSILLTSALIIIYNVFVLSYTGIVSESISIISAAIGIVRFAKKDKNESKKAGQ